MEKKVLKVLPVPKKCSREVKRGCVCKVLVTNPRHWLHVHSIIHSPPRATDTGCHYPALFEAYAGIIYVKTFQLREKRPGKCLSEQWILHKSGASQPCFQPGESSLCNEGWSQN